MKILVAEDDIVSRRLLQTVLAQWGYDVISVAEGNEAWKELQGADAPQLAILDWEMPGMNGLDICRRLRRIRTTTPIYVILLTARGDKKDVIQGLDAGADDYIVKPFDNDELRARINAGCRIIELQATLAKKEKLQGVLEMAGAVCHELNQPLQAAAGYSELLLMNFSAENPMYESVQRIKKQIDRMTKITRKLMAITRYETRDYLDGKIIDIDKASE